MKIALSRHLRVLIKKKKKKNYEFNVQKWNRAAGALDLR
jgi:hypothetical protein